MDGLYTKCDGYPLRMVYQIRDISHVNGIRNAAIGTYIVKYHDNMLSSQQPLNDTTQITITDGSGRTGVVSGRMVQRRDETLEGYSLHHAGLSWHNIL